jgi:hypothetical protein
LILPLPGERNVHGNASFEPAFLERAMSEAAAEGAGLALLHSHPLGKGWQGMSRDDVRAEQGNAGRRVWRDPHTFCRAYACERRCLECALLDSFGTAHLRKT